MKARGLSPWLPKRGTSLLCQIVIGAPSLARRQAYNPSVRRYAELRRAGGNRKEQQRAPLPLKQMADKFDLLEHELVKKMMFDEIDRLERALGIQQPEDWFTVTLAEAHELGLPKRLVKNRMHLVEWLQQKYPSHQWDKMLITTGRYGQQRRLEQAVTTLFPGIEVKINARKEAWLVNPSTGDYLELDVFVPSLNLGFEFQERHHYTREDTFARAPLEEQQARDQLKRELAKKSGVTLITVPCWWDRQLESLAASIKLHRPDLIHTMLKVEEGIPINDSPPPGFFGKQVKEVEDIGEPINACFFTNSSINPTNWWVFEKYDGLRGFWNPLKQAVFSRGGNKFNLPQEVIDDMPSDLFLDGELWFGRDNFQESMKIAHRMDHDKIHWNSFRFMVFDIPTSKGNYQERYQQLQQELNGKNHRFVQIAPYTLCEGTDHLEKIFQDIMDQGGEGIILRDPASPFQSGRSSGFLKHKKYRDAEAKIVGRASLSTWECEMPDGVRFVAPAGTTEFAKRWNPQPGDIVSFKHRGFMLVSNKPKIPTLFRIRDDITWDDVVQNKRERVVMPTTIRPIRRKGTRQTKGYWGFATNRRQFLIDFAQKMGFDPMHAENWQFRTSSIRQLGGRSLLHKYKGSIQAMIQDTLEEVSFEKGFMPRLNTNVKKVNYWADRDTRRQFLLEFAEKMRFDPMQKANWEGMSSKLQAYQGKGLLERYYMSMKELLADTFPEMDPNSTKPDSYWDNLEHRRAFLTSFAQTGGFDPFMVTNWRHRLPQIRAFGGSGLLDRYESVNQMLVDSFPERLMSAQKLKSAYLLA